MTHIGLLRPHFCLMHKIFDVTILAKPFVFRSLKHYEILSWPPTCPVMYEVMRSFCAIKTNTHLPFAFEARFRVCTLLVREYATKPRRIRATFSKGQKREKHNRGRPDDQKTLSRMHTKMLIVYNTEC